MPQWLAVWPSAPAADTLGGSRRRIDPAGLATNDWLQPIERAQPGDTILRPTRSPDDLTAELLRFGAGLVTLVLAIVLGFGT